jgi:hypothetical protein
MEKEEKHEHPSFGQISFSRVTCHPSISFYGSELPQDHYITMELRNSEINRELTQDRYYPKGVPIVKIRMTSGFQETMDEVVFEAKTEVENAIQHKINTLGLSALHEQNELLENK